MRLYPHTPHTVNKPSQIVVVDCQLVANKSTQLMHRIVNQSSCAVYTT